MIVSTKGRYALRVMVCLAQKDANAYIPLKEIAEAEHISQKYLESIMTTLSKADFVDAVHGKGGGYRLNRQHSEADRRLFGSGILLCHRSCGLFPNHLLRSQAYVGSAGFDD